MPAELLASAIVGGLFLGVVVFLELGWRIGRLRRSRDPEASSAGGMVEGATFALLGLLIAFSFASAAARFDMRRSLITEEANAIGTAWLRLDLLPVESRESLRAQFRRYLDQRIETARYVRDLDSFRAASAHSASQQAEIWQTALAAIEMPEGERARMLLVPALNQMFDTATTRNRAVLTHQPLPIFVILVGLVVASALVAGEAMAVGGRRLPTGGLVYAAVMSLTIFVILDLEFPRIGFIQIAGADQVMLDLRTSMGDGGP